MDYQALSGVPGDPKRSQEKWGCPKSWYPGSPILTCWENSIWVGKIKDLDQRLKCHETPFSYSHLIIGVPNFDPHPFQGSEFMKTQMELGGQFLNP